MKRIFLILFIVVSFAGVSQETIQVAGITISAMKHQDLKEYDGEVPYEKWLQSEEGAYYMVFKQTPVGYKHSLDKVKEILEINNLSFDNDRIKESILIPPICDGIFDYHCLAFRFKIGDAEVSLGWLTENGEAIVLLCNDESFALALMKQPD